jgi:hypothetical protein
MSNCLVRPTRYSCPIIMKLEFPDSIPKNSQISNIIKIRPVGTRCSMRTDGRTDGRTARRMDMTKLIFAFRNIADEPKSGNCALMWRKINYSN